ncbi:MAG: HEAT repeat domain-containing protein [Planctomycetota bacterium]
MTTLLVVLLIVGSPDDGGASEQPVPSAVTKTVEVLVGRLSHRDPAVREAAVLQLLEIGDPAADRLEKGVLAAPEARRLAARLLRRLRGPRLAIVGPRVIGRSEPDWQIELVVSNPGRQPAGISDFWIASSPGPGPQFGAPIGKGVRPNGPRGPRIDPHWTFVSDLTAAAPKPGPSTVRGPYGIPTGTKLRLAMIVPLESKPEGRYSVSVTYEAEEYRFEASAEVQVVDDTVVKLDAMVRSTDASRRELALQILARRARESRVDPSMRRGIAAAVGSPLLSVRVEAARFLGLSGQKHHTAALLKLADPAHTEVSLEALGGLFRLHGESATMPRAMTRLLTRAFGTGVPWPATSVAKALRIVPPPTRVLVLSQVLSVSRSPRVHAAVCELLEGYGIHVAIEPVTKRVPRSEIRRLTALGTRAGD